MIQASAGATFVTKTNKVNNSDNETRQKTLHRRRVETGATAEHPGQGATLFQFDVLQPGDQRGHDAFVPGANQRNRSSLSRGRRRRGSYSRAAWLSAVVAGSGIAGSTRPRYLRLRRQRTLGLDRAVARSRTARTQAGLSIAARSCVELFRS